MQPILAQLFSSAIRIRIFKFLVTHYDEEFTAAQIAKRTGAIVRSTNKELAKLVPTNAVLEVTKPAEINHKQVHIKHYQANRDFFLFPETYELFMKLQVHDVEAFQEQLKKLGDVRYLALTGRFTGVTDAAVDVLIVGNVNKQRCAKIMRDFEKVVGWEVNWTLLDTDDFVYRREIGDMFTYNVAMSKKIEVINDLDKM